MNRLSLALSLALATCGSTLPAAHAAELFDFRFISPTISITGQLLGTVLADGNTVQVDAIQGVPLIDGLPFIALPFIDSIIDVATSGGSFEPRVSLNGQVMDFAACGDASCDDAFGFDGSGSLTGSPIAVVVNGGSIGFSGYSPSSWTLSPVPGAGSGALMALGLAGLFWRLRRNA